MDKKKVFKVVGAVVVAGLVGASGVGIGAHFFPNEVSKEVIKEVKVADLSACPVAEEKVCAVCPADVSGDLDICKAKLSLHEDAIVQDSMEQGALALAELEFEDLEFLSDLKAKLVDMGYNVEDRDDIVSIRFVDKEDVEFDLDEEVNGVEGSLSGEVRVIFKEDGFDGDRSRVNLPLVVDFFEGEVDTFDFS